MERRNFVVAVVIVILILLFVVYAVNKPEEENYERPSPAKIVEQYFNSWNNKDYVNMYATISDGFKKIEPTAKDLSTFREYVESQDISGINISDIEERSNDGNTAQVDYSVGFTLKNGKKQKFDGIFTLKYRNADIIQGWKLIYPYGENIDAS